MREDWKKRALAAEKRCRELEIRNSLLERWAHPDCEILDDYIKSIDNRENFRRELIDEYLDDA